MGRRESRDEWARSLGLIVQETGGHWVRRKYFTEVGIISGVQVGWAGPGLGPGQQVPGPGEAGQGVGPQQVCPVYLGQGEVDTMYQHCRQVGTRRHDLINASIE